MRVSQYCTPLKFSGFLLFCHYMYICQFDGWSHVISVFFFGIFFSSWYLKFLWLVVNSTPLCFSFPNNWFRVLSYPSFNLTFIFRIWSINIFVIKIDFQRFKVSLILSSTYHNESHHGPIRVKKHFQGETD